MIERPPRRVHIIGRGIVGLSLGWELARRGWEVTMVGPKEKPGSATVAAVGLSSVKGQILGQKPLFAAKLRGHEILASWLSQLEKEAGLILPRDLQGVVETFEDVTGYDGIRERVFHQQFLGCHRVRLLDRTALDARGVTRLEPLAQGGFHYFRDLWFDPRAALKLLESCLRARGVPFLDVEVERVAFGSNGDLALHMRQPDEHGIVPLSQVILAAGAASSAILSASSLAHFALEEVPGDTVVGAHADLPPLLLRRGKTNLVVHGKDLIAGSTAYAAGKERPDPRRTLALPAFLLKDGAPLQILSGARARFRDRCPAIGPALQGPLPPHFWVALGFYKNGLQLAPLFAQFLANWMETGDPSSVPPAFSSTRFFA